MGRHHRRPANYPRLNAQELLTGLRDASPSPLLAPLPVGQDGSLIENPPGIGRKVLQHNPTEQWLGVLARLGIEGERATGSAATYYLTRKRMHSVLSGSEVQYREGYSSPELWPRRLEEVMGPALAALPSLRKGLLLPVAKVDCTYLYPWRAPRSSMSVALHLGATEGKGAEQMQVALNEFDFFRRFLRQPTEEKPAPLSIRTLRVSLLHVPAEVQGEATDFPQRIEEALQPVLPSELRFARGGPIYDE